MTTENMTLEQEAEAQKAAAAAAQNQDPVLHGEEPKPERPEWLPEKFNSPEDLLKSYSELEAKLSANPEENQGEAEEVVAKAGLDMDALSAEYTKDGKLSDESMAKLKDAGIPEAMVNAYIDSVTTQAAEQTAKFLEPVGGQEGYDQMLTWASDNMDDAAIDAYNGALQSGNSSVIQMAVENLHRKYVDANGQEPAVTVTGEPGNSSATVYEGTADLMKDMQNPEYHTNAAFRKKVHEKLGRSNLNL